jgi:hypothetical protein
VIVVLRTAGSSGVTTSHQWSSIVSLERAWGRHLVVVAPVDEAEDGVQLFVIGIDVFPPDIQLCWLGLESGRAAPLVAPWLLLGDCCLEGDGVADVRLHGEDRLTTQPTSQEDGGGGHLFIWGCDIGPPDHHWQEKGRHLPHQRRRLEALQVDIVETSWLCCHTTCLKGKSSEIFYFVFFREWAPPKPLT